MSVVSICTFYHSCRDFYVYCTIISRNDFCNKVYHIRYHMIWLYWVVTLWYVKHPCIMQEGIIHRISNGILFLLIICALLFHKRSPNCSYKWATIIPSCAAAVISLINLHFFIMIIGNWNCGLVFHIPLKYFSNVVLVIFNAITMNSNFVIP